MRQEYLDKPFTYQTLLYLLIISYKPFLVHLSNWMPLYKGKLPDSSLSLSFSDKVALAAIFPNKFLIPNILFMKFVELPAPMKPGTIKNNQKSC